MDPKIVKKTQDTLGKIIKKPPLTEKLLSKPPFRFLHDIMTSVIRTTGFMKGLYTETEMNSENVKDKDAKISFLQKAIDMVVAVTGQRLLVKPLKVVAGHEPDNTNEFLQALAAAINAKVDNEDYVKRVLSGGGGSGKGEREERKDSDHGDVERTRSAGRKRDSQDKQRKGDDDRSQDRAKDKEKSRGDRHRDRDSNEKEHEHNRERDQREKSQDREERRRDKERDHDKDHEKDREKRRKVKEAEEKENETPETNAEKESTQDTSFRLQRPASAKGSRRRRQGRDNKDEEDEEFQQRGPDDNQESGLGDDDLPPQITAARRMARPSSARPAPPRPKHEGSEVEPAVRLGSGAPTNLITDSDRQSEDEDENFLVEEAAPPPLPVPEQSPDRTEPDDVEHGALVKKMLESKKEAEQQQQPSVTKKTEIERPTLLDVQRRKQREMVSKEIERLQISIQSLTRSANPLGKIMDYVQEDLDSMQKELDRWRGENKEHALALRRERSVTDRAVEPLKAQLADLERAISDQLDLIAATKSNILRNDQRIDKILRSLAKS